MINAPRLLADLTQWLRRLEDDLRARIAELAPLQAALQAEWAAAREAQRTAETVETWAGQVITQAGVHWLLSGVFLRFIEDNQLVDRPWLGGPPASADNSGRLALAQDQHQAYFRAHPLHSDRDYLLAAFTQAGRLPGLQTLSTPPTTRSFAYRSAATPQWRCASSGSRSTPTPASWSTTLPTPAGTPAFWATCTRT